MIETVTIVGLGLIGGSLAKALREKKVARKIYGVDQSEEYVRMALDDGVLDDGGVAWKQEMNDSDLVFFCVPVGMTVPWLKQLVKSVKKGCVFTDVGSTKQQITSQVDEMEEEFVFVAGHPMAGSEKTGYPASKAQMFENVYYMVTPSYKSTPQAVKFLCETVRQIGAIDLVIPPDQHDTATAAVSHLPHVIASSLVNMIESMDTGGSITKLAAGGFRDVTRIAASSPRMWTDITLSNKYKLLYMLDRYMQELTVFKNFLAQDAEQDIYRFFKQGKESRERLPQKAAGLLPRSYECSVDVKDQVGAIGKVAGLLAQAGINLKNIHIANSREFSGGVLILSFGEPESQEKAVATLRSHGYEVSD